MSRVLLAGDTHGNREQIRFLFMLAEQHDCPRIVQLGDFGYWPHMDDRFLPLVAEGADAYGVDFLWLDGNHENFDALAQTVDLDASEPQQMHDNVWYLPRGCIWEWEDVRFMSLGGAYSIDKHHRVEGVSWWPQELITYAQAQKAIDSAAGMHPGINVLLTHDAPEGACPIVSRDYKGDEISRGNRMAVTAVRDALQPQLLAHGHYHHRYTAQLDGTRIEGLGRDGDLDGSWLVLDLDEFRADR